MPEIAVWGAVLSSRGVLLVRESRRGVETWRLIGSVFPVHANSMEEWIKKDLDMLLAASLDEEPEFFDTVYERRPDGSTVVHNFFVVPASVLDLSEQEMAEEAAGTYGESCWATADDIEGLPLDDWLRQGLLALLRGQPLGPQFDLADLRLGTAPLLPPVIVVTGPVGAGKSTVAIELCKRFDRAAHISADLLRDMVVSGYASPAPGRSDPEEAAAQNRLVTENAAALARNFTHAGMVVVIDEVLETRDGLDDLLEALGPDQDVRFVTLLPDAEELARRDRLRPPADRMGTRSGELRQIIAANGETRGIRLDTTCWSVGESVDIILERLEEARVAPSPGPSPTSWERDA